MAVKHYYSVEAFSEHDVAFPKYLVAVGRGVNVFTLATEDIQQALSEFAQEKVRVDKVHALDGVETFHELPGAGFSGGDRLTSRSVLFVDGC